MKNILFLSLVLGCCWQTISGQEIANDTIVYKGEHGYMPNDTVQDWTIDYQALESQVKADIDWLNYTPLGERQDVRDDKNRFVLMWMSGVPYMKMKIDDRIVTFSEGEPWLVMAYMIGWTKYFLENNYSQNEIQLSIAGIKNVVNFYNRNKKIYLEKNKAVEAYVKLEKAGKLEEYISSALLSGE
ncbi:hypothetical protein [Dysgonomonas macrotermitis]|uniref:Uncharacterized protein n=1 Tax=Dysgonomonas macrotermitis TaxID=1346286 RepID=A0A1M5FBD5_9BACT|nr:hypothetical protein [Dysgonomonas macrotermitis]SHF88837.1 hypothetical protein SAMN05444362_111118 [Dysgonomonas macrotermitis]